MAALGKKYAVLTRYIRSLRGGSQPILAKASDGLLYVVKFSNNLQGPNLLFNESAGIELYRACGLAVPMWKPLLLSDSFLDNNPDCWIQTPEGRLRPASGLCFGSRFLGSEGVSLLEILAETDYRRIRDRNSFWLAWLIDVCAEHVDNRQAVFAKRTDGWLDAFFVDQGHLFGGPKADQRKHFRASCYLDPRIYPDVSSDEVRHFQKVVRTFNADRLWQRVNSIPADWKHASALSRFASCLHRLTEPLLLQNVLDTIVDAQARKAGRDLGSPAGQRKPPDVVLYSRVQASELERSTSTRPFCPPACA